MSTDPVFDGDAKTHRTIDDGRATINFDGKYYVYALRIPTSNDKFALRLNSNIYLKF